ncbi:MAG: RND family transporter [Rhodospirillales bacterium]|nr:RND family transporter [Rhodospirillales bacterium]
MTHDTQDRAPIVERLLFGWRAAVVALVGLVTVLLAYQATRLGPDASFEKMIPAHHPFIANYFDHKHDLRALGNVVRIIVENTEGDIYSADFLEKLKQINDEAFFVKGVDRANMQSLWTPAVRWMEVTEDGFAGGPVISDAYDGSPGAVEAVRRNVARSGQIGRLVANDHQSAVIYAPILDVDPETGEKLSYAELSDALETKIRTPFQTGAIRIHITGFAKVVGDLIEGLEKVVYFFAFAFVITLAILFAFFGRCLRGSIAVVMCSTIAVVWQLGLLNALGYGLDPYSMLVPFLVFAIGVSHGVQVVNAVKNELARGANRLHAARRAFRALYVPGLIALVSDGIGFATLLIIDIQVIRELAIGASLGVAVVIVTNLMLLPILLSYFGVSDRSLKRWRGAGEAKPFALWSVLATFARRRPAMATAAIAALLFAGGLWQGRDLQIGDLDRGAPELRADSRYNRDNQFLIDHYASSTDILVVMAKTAPQRCSATDAVYRVDQLQWRLENMPEVQSVASLANVARMIISARNEGSLKFFSLTSNQQVMDSASVAAPPGVINGECSLIPILVYLQDHKAGTLQRVVDTVEAFAAEHDTAEVRFLLAAGNAGIEAATNSVIATAQYEMLAWVYLVVGLLVLATFRSWVALFSIVLPLALTSALCQALMTFLGIGVKVATLPVIALGVGIGVDYGIYIYSRLEGFLKEGLPLIDAYLQTLRSTGKAVILTGATLAIGVGTWAWSPIKFQADMGILLTFMFLWNMLGAVVLLPAIACLFRRREERLGLRAPALEEGC